MFRPAFVCNRCQRRAARRLRAAAGPQWHSKATFISLANRPPPDQTDQVTEANFPRNQSSRKPPSPLHDSLLEQLPFTYRPGRYSRTEEQEGQGAQDHSYGNGKHNQRESEHLQQEEGIARTQPLRQPVGAAAKLDELLQDPEQVDAAWALFIRFFGWKDSPHLVKPAYQDFKYLQHGDVFKKLLLAAVSRWMTNPKAHARRPAEMIAQMDEAGVLRPNFAEAVGWSIAESLLSRGAIDGAENLGPDSQLLLEELVSWWTAFLVRHGDEDAKRTGQPSLSSIMHSGRRGPLENKPRVHTPWAFEGALVTLLRDYRGLHRDLAQLALVSCGLLFRENQNHRFGESKREDCDRLVILFANVLYRRRIDHTLNGVSRRLRNFETRPSQSAIDSYLNRLATLPENALAYAAAATARLQANRSSRDDLDARLQDDQDEPALESIDATEKTTRFFAARLGRAAASEDFIRLESTWRNIQSYYAERCRYGEGQHHIRIPEELYRVALMKYITLRRPKEAIEIWNFMVRNGTEPSVKIWTAMLEGCKQAHDFKGAEDLWNRMRSSGVQLDVYAYSVRLFCLMQTQQVKEGLTELEEIGQRWREAAIASKPRRSQSTKTVNWRPVQQPFHQSMDLSDVGDFPHAPKPTIALVNPVISAVSKLERPELISRVLEWAKSFQIEPDIRTLNTLISAAFNRGDEVAAMRTLQQMSKAGVQPDDTTFGIIVDQTVRRASLSEMSEEELEKKIFGILADLEKNGHPPNDRLYTIIIDGILRQHASYAVAQAVLKHMYDRNMEPSERLYSKVMSYFFRLSPPHIAGVDAILARIQSQGNRWNNLIYDRFVEGYARAGELDKMMRLVRQMSKENRRPSWKPLHKVVEALEYAGKYDLMNEIIMDVEVKEGIARDGLRGSTSANHDGFIEMRKFFGLIGRLRKEGKAAPSINPNRKISNDDMIPESASSSAATAAVPA